MIAADVQARRFDHRYIYAYALAAAGGSIAYTPFLTILLPMQVANLAGDQSVTWISYLSLTGALAASAFNITFGWLSDRSGTRVRWISCGLMASCLLLVAFSFATSLAMLLGLIVAWQAALNLMLAPLGALAGDRIADVQKGKLGGLLALAPAAGAATAVFVTLPGFADAEMRLWVTAGMVAICVLPVLVLEWGQRPAGHAAAGLPVAAAASHANADPRPHRFLILMWAARFLLQISEAALFAFLYFWFRSVDGDMNDARIAQIFAVILAASVPLALLAGNWSDRRARPFAPLWVCAATSTVGLLLMAFSQGLPQAIAGYVVFGLTASAFLSLHSSQTLRVLPSPETRGRVLGFFNLANTVPSLVMPWLTLALVPSFGFMGLFLALAACTFSASLLTYFLRTGR